MVHWETVSSLATGVGTLVLAAATFASVRSANRAARVAEESLLSGIRPLLVPSRPEDVTQQVSFADDHSVRVPGGAGTAEVTDEAIYLTLSIRNAGSGIAVLHGWRFDPTTALRWQERPSAESFHRLTRDLYIPAGDLGFWQGVLRHPTGDESDPLRDRIVARERIILDLLYSDYQGGQRIIGRFSLLPDGEGGWLASVARHWNVDRPDPR
ncbi:hypothetical protein [Wenjunlia tyrosinilytica]|uniref:Uncharacterized protein n=1 Tax=Wenjunlia tyrosinilytica TaxID=1544741 RepID=A0A917ZSY9_9ACTN|nr:hypothetical protein [Wenjunlia tyrosinilytica]GGO90407.1 hypothetical protein GCM10012280_35890 [Wenjunlia tyrosinilytica]